MSRQKLKITYLDGKTNVVTISPRAEVETERHFDSSMGQFQKDAKAQHLYYLAWAAAHASKVEHEGFEEFLNKIEDVDPVEDPKDDGQDDPTQPAQSPAPLSN